MRKPSFVNTLKTVLVVVPLLTGCGNGTNTSPPVVVVDPNGLILPDCTEGQLVGVNPDQTLGCVTVSSMLTPPKCNTGTQALTSNKDSVTGKTVLSCVDKGTGATDVSVTTRITNASNSISTLQTTITALTTGGGTRSKYVGATSTKTAGVITNTNMMGVTTNASKAASAICLAAFPGNDGIHTCTPMEIYESLVIGDKLNQNTAAITTPLMVYMQSWVKATNASEPNAGLTDNCGGDSYGTGDHFWHNTSFTFNTASASGTTKVAKFDQSTGCAASVSIACCK